MTEIRIREGLPCKGVSLPRVYVTNSWIAVDEETAEYARTFRLHATNANSPLVFEEREVPEEIAPPKEVTPPEEPKDTKPAAPQKPTKPAKQDSKPDASKPEEIAPPKEVTPPEEPKDAKPAAPQK